MNLAVLTSPVVYPLLFGLTFLDGFIPVVPSESAVITASAFGVSGQPVLLGIIVVAAVGAFVGDHIAYWLGRLLRGRDGRFGRYVGRLTERATGQLGSGAGVVILTGRFIPCGRLAVTLACGAGRYPLRRFSAWTALATTAWATFTVLIGYLGGIAFAETPWLGAAAGLILGLVVSAALGLASRRGRRPGSHHAARPSSAIVAGTSTNSSRMPETRNIS